MNRPREHCGVFGVFGPDDAVLRTFYGLWSLQHRGQESAGIVSSDGETVLQHRGMGLVSRVFTPEVLRKLTNRTAIGHVRYSTTGSSTILNAQPFVLVHMLANPAHIAKPEGALVHSLNRLQGAYSLLLLRPGEMIAARDPHGVRPLWLGKVPGGYAVSSESCPFLVPRVGAEPIREIEPGELVTVTDEGVRSEIFAPSEEIQPKYCIFEHVYFARPDSTIFGDNVHEVRKRMGARLAEEHPVEADVVTPVPDSGNSAALGFSQQSGIPLDFGFIRNHYVGRTFIQPDQDQRSMGVEIKLNVLREVVRSKRVVVVDDSIIRGTTSRGRIRTLRDAGAREVHLRLSCPPTRHPCFYGIDFPTSTELLASGRTGQEIRDFLEVDSVEYLSLDGMLSCVSNPPDHYCSACFTGEYPLPVPDGLGKFVFERNK